MSGSETRPSGSRASRARWIGLDQLDTGDLLGLVLGERAGRTSGPGLGPVARGPGTGGSSTGGSGPSWGGAGWGLEPLVPAGGKPAPPGGSAALPDLLTLSRAAPAELEREWGFGPAEADRLAAAFALGRRLARFRRPPRAPLRSAERVARLFEEELAGLHQESFHVLALDGRHALLGRIEVSRGTLTTSLVHPREVFRPAIARGAAAVIGLHNHPSGDPEPSADDLAVTRRLIEAGHLLGIPLLDHVVLGAGRFVSLRSRMDFERLEPR